MSIPITRAALHSILIQRIDGQTAEDIIADVEQHIANAADLDGKPRLHRGASAAQRMSVEQIAAKGISDKRLRALTLVNGHTHTHTVGDGAGVTCDELEQRYDLPHSSISARLNWLERQGLVERMFHVHRRTRSGGQANPYVTTEAGHRLVAMLGRWDQ